MQVNRRETAMFDRLKSATSGVASGVSNGLGNLQQMAAEKLQGTMDEVNASAPFLARVGYSLLRLQVEIGLSPKVILTLSQREAIDPEAFARVLAEASDRKVLASILSALQQANALQGKIQVRGCFFRDIEIELGIPPAVRMIFLGAEMAVVTATMAAPSVEVEANSVALRIPEGSVTSVQPTSVVLSPPAAASGEPPLEEVAAGSRQEEGFLGEVDQPIRFRCSHCRVRYKTRAERAGELLKCRRCGKVLSIPTRSTVEGRDHS
jgi:hypothetical protein